MSTTAGNLRGGFLAPPIDSARAFRQIMSAMARPGTIHELAGAAPPTPVSRAAGTVLLTLCDHDTPLCYPASIDASDVVEWFRFHTGAPLVDAAGCQFAYGTWQALQPVSPYPVGTDDYPDRSATLIIEVEELRNDTGVYLTGPGIQHLQRFLLPEAEAFFLNSSLYPLGLDFMFTCGSQLAALPRSTQISREPPVGSDASCT